MGAVIVPHRKFTAVMARSHDGDTGHRMEASMAFRIDRIANFVGRWRFQIKGIGGQGIYGVLITGTDDHVLCDEEGRIIDESFYVPADASSQEASRLLASALHRADWGPEVNQAGSVVASATYEYQLGRR